MNESGLDIPGELRDIMNEFKTAADEVKAEISSLFPWLYCKALYCLSVFRFFHVLGVVNIFLPDFSPGTSNSLVPMGVDQVSYYRLC